LYHATQTFQTCERASPPISRPAPTPRSPSAASRRCWSSSTRSRARCWPRWGVGGTGAPNAPAP